MSTIQVKGVLELDGSGWDKTLARAEHGVNKLAEDSLGELKRAITGAFAAGAVLELARSAVEFGAQIKRTSDELGISAEKVQELSFAFTQAGLQSDQVGISIERLARNMEKAVEGGKGAKELEEAFGRLGVSMADLKSKTDEEIFRQIGEALEHTAVTARVSADMMEVFGKAVGRLIPVLQELREKSEELHASGLVITDKELEMMHKGEQGFEKLSLAAKVWTSREISGFKLIFGGLSGSEDSLGGQIAKQWNPNQLDEDLAKARGDQADKELARMKKDAADLQAYKELIAHGAPAATESKEEKAEAKKLEKDRAAELNRLLEENAKGQARLDYEKLSDQQKMAFLLKEEKELREQIARAGSESLLGARDTHALQGVEEEINRLNQKESRQTHAPAFQGNSLVRVGNFLGSSANSIASIGERTNQILTQIHGTLRGMGKGGSFGGTGVPSH